MTQSILASLFSSATTTLLAFIRDSKPTTHAPRRSRVPSRCITQLQAPWIRRRRTYLLTRLLNPSSAVLLPVEYWGGVSPSQAARSWPVRNCLPLPTTETIAVAVSGSIRSVGIFVSSRRRNLSKVVASVAVSQFKPIPSHRPWDRTV